MATKGGPHNRIRALFIVFYLLAVALVALGLWLWLVQDKPVFGPIVFQTGATTLLLNGLLDFRQRWVYKQYCIFALEAIGHSATKLLDLVGTARERNGQLQREGATVATTKAWIAALTASINSSWQRYQEDLHDYNVSFFQVVNYKVGHDLKEIVDQQRAQFQSVKAIVWEGTVRDTLYSTGLVLETYEEQLQALQRTVIRQLKRLWFYGPKHVPDEPQSSVKA